jgi:hypothetical protein
VKKGLGCRKLVQCRFDVFHRRLLDRNANLVKEKLSDGRFFFDLEMQGLFYDEVHVILDGHTKI